MAELGRTPGVYLCTGCALWAARRSVGLPDLGSVVHRLRHALGRRWRSGGHHHHDGEVGSVVPVLPATDLDRTAVFWRALGFEVAERFEGYLVTHAYGIEIHFLADGGSGPQGFAVVFVHVTDASAMWTRLSADGVPGLGPVVDQEYGLREFVVTDPDGNRARFGSAVP